MLNKKSVFCFFVFAATVTSVYADPMMMMGMPMRVSATSTATAPAGEMMPFQAVADCGAGNIAIGGSQTCTFTAVDGQSPMGACPTMNSASPAMCEMSGNTMTRYWMGSCIAGPTPATLTVFATCMPDPMMMKDSKNAPSSTHAPSTVMPATAPMNSPMSTTAAPATQPEHVAAATTANTATPASGTAAQPAPAAPMTAPATAPAVQPAVAPATTMPAMKSEPSTVAKN